MGQFSLFRSLRLDSSLFTRGDKGRFFFLVKLLKHSSLRAPLADLQSPSHLKWSSHHALAADVYPIVIFSPTYWSLMLDSKLGNTMKSLLKVSCLEEP